MSPTRADGAPATRYSAHATGVTASPRSRYALPRRSASAGSVAHAAWTTRCARLRYVAGPQLATRGRAGQRNRRAARTDMRGVRSRSVVVAFAGLLWRTVSNHMIVKRVSILDGLDRPLVPLATFYMDGDAVVAIFHSE